MKAKNVAFRVDASFEIGSGHVMRCLTLAQALRESGVTCTFMCADLPGNMCNFIKKNGFEVWKVSRPHSACFNEEALSSPLDHSRWLGCSQLEDAQLCKRILRENFYDWIVVDHYALDAAWERELRHCCSKILVIDDLADRLHDCELLVDQSLGRRRQDYKELVGCDTTLMVGASYALLRPEFFSFRASSLARRRNITVKHITINMGGADSGNATGQILEVLKNQSFLSSLIITVIMGGLSPWVDAVKASAERLRSQVEVVVSISNMAEVMSNSDLMIGAAGSTSWERCCLGVPALMVVLADNQEHIAAALQSAKAAVSVGRPSDRDFSSNVLNALKCWLERPELLRQCSEFASHITDGLGVDRVVTKMVECYENNRAL